MDQPLDWLPGAEGTVWVALGIAKQAGLPIPAGFIVFASTREERIRSTYEELKIREKPHREMHAPHTGTETAKDDPACGRHLESCRARWPTHPDDGRSIEEGCGPRRRGGQKHRVGN